MLRPITWLSLAIALVTLPACKEDPNTPEYWDKALKNAKKLKERNRILEDLRESISLIRVLHDAVTLSGVADMGAQLPLLSASPAERLGEIQALAAALLDFEKQQQEGCRA